MRIVVDINHPAHVHYFKNFIRIMRERGHEVLITASEKDVAFQLLDSLGFEYVNLGSYGKTPLEKAFNIISMDIKMYRAIKNFNPDVLIGFGSIRAAHVSRLIDKPSVIFDDTEHATFEHLLYRPFAYNILTPCSFNKKMGNKHVRFNGYMELAALHPKYFRPNLEIIKELGISEGEKFTIVRFVSWQANHDIGHHGIHDKIGFVHKLEKYGRVLISSEGKIPPELVTNLVHVTPEKMHDLLYFATMYVGEGATMASEAAVLGTHAIYVNTLSLGYIADEESKYGLVTDFSRRTITDEDVISKATELLGNDELVVESKLKRERIITEKVDLTAFMVSFVEDYPNSMKSLKNGQAPWVGSGTQ